MYKVRYYRNEQVAQRYRDNGVTHKPAGWVIAKINFESLVHANKLIDYFRDQGIAAELVRATNGKGS